MEETYIDPCACLGPQCGEPFCPCVMRTRGLPRSAEWQEYHSPENMAVRQQQLEKALSRFIQEEEK